MKNTQGQQLPMGVTVQEDGVSLFRCSEEGEGMLPSPVSCRGKRTMCQISDAAK